jgi:selenium metabolism protein YedF
MAASEGGNVTSEKVADKEYKITIVLDGAVKTADDTADENLVVVVSSDRMGAGNDDLGKVLIKGFIFAVTQLEKLPKTMLFYNGGATLTAEGSDSLEDLKHLAEQGVEILTCGTCLNYYELTDKLQVGSVTNMYTIVEKMAGADKIIQP